jgi:hypothetical protein
VREPSSRFRPTASPVRARRGALAHALVSVVVVAGTAACSFLHPGSDYDDGVTPEQLNPNPNPTGDGAPDGVDGGNAPPLQGEPVKPAPPAVEDTSGQATYFRVYGGTAAEQFYGVVTLPSERTLIVGQTESAGAGSKDAVVSIVDREGKSLASRLFGGAGNDQLYSLAPVADGTAFYGCGLTRSFPDVGAREDEGLVARFDKDGVPVWAKYIGSTGNDIFFATATTPDGGVVCAGRTDSNGAGMYDGFVVKLDATGAVVWQRIVGGAEIDELVGITVAPDGMIYAVGRSHSFNAVRDDAFVVSFNAAGALQGARLLGASNDERANAILFSEGVLLVGGTTFSFGLGNGDGWILTLDTKLDVVWSRAIGTSRADTVVALAANKDRVYVTGATSMPDMSSPPAVLMAAVRRTDGAPLWSKRIIATGPVSTGFASLELAPDGSLLVVGSQQPTGQTPDAIIARMTSTGEIRGGCGQKLVDAKADVTVANLTSRVVTPIVKNVAMAVATAPIVQNAGLQESAADCTP